MRLFLLKSRIYAAIVFFMNKDPKKIVEELVEMLGKQRAERLLIEADISPSTAGKLVRGKYPSQIRFLMGAAIAKAREAAAEAS